MRLDYFLFIDFKHSTLNLKFTIKNCMSYAIHIVFGRYSKTQSVFQS